MYTHDLQYRADCLTDSKQLCIVGYKTYRPIGAYRNRAIAFDLLGLHVMTAAASLLRTVKRRFQPTQRTQSKERNGMTSLLDRPFTAAILGCDARIE